MAKNNEQWRPIPGYGGMYEVSKHGEIRSWRINKPGHDTTERAAEPYMISTHLRKKKGRGLVLEITLWNGTNKDKPRAVKNLMRDVWLEGEKPGLYVQLIDGDPAHCAVHNMRYATMDEINKSKKSYSRRPVVKRDENGAAIGFYKSIRAAAQKHYITTSGMHSRIKRRTVADGVWFEYAD